MNAESGANRSGRRRGCPARRANSVSRASFGRWSLSRRLRISLRLPSKLINPRSNARSKWAARQSPFLGFSRSFGNSLHGSMWLATNRSPIGFPVMQHLESYAAKITFLKKLCIVRILRVPRVSVAISPEGCSDSGTAISGPSRLWSFSSLSTAISSQLFWNSRQISSSRRLWPGSPLTPRARCAGSKEAKLVSFIARLEAVRPSRAATSMIRGFRACICPKGSVK